MDAGTAYVIITSLIVSAIVLNPIAKGLGRYLTGLGESRRKDAPAAPAPELRAELDRTRDELERTRTELERLAERQEFLEALVAEKALPAAGAGAQNATV
ncbi:MAG TPA: hypothetical protein VF092_22755 [Longimicrobium sp.]